MVPHRFAWKGGEGLKDFTISSVPQFMEVKKIRGDVDISSHCWRKSGKLSRHTFPKTNIAPENRPSQKELVFQPSKFSGAMLVSGRMFQSKVRSCQV